jgi:hypothetical protein
VRQETSRAGNPYRSFFWTLLLGGIGGALLFGQACEDGDLDDDDDTPRLDEDDDDAGEDDDDAGPNDDDVVIPDGIPIGGTLTYQNADGVVPEGNVLGGLFPAELGEAGATFGSERLSNFLAEGLGGGIATFALYVPEELDAGELTPIPGADGVSAATFAPFAYVDGNGSGGFNAGDVLLAATSDWVMYIAAASAEDIPEALEGAGLGWNLVRSVGDDAEITHIPEGVNSSQGMSMRVRLLPVVSGTVPVDAEIAFPEGSRIAAWHGTLSGLMKGDAPANPVLFVTSAVNTLREDLIDWAIDGAPPGDHIGTLPSEILSDTVLIADLTGALYSQVGWVDDGDQIYDDQAPCDLLIAEGDKTLVWVAPPGQNLWLAYNLGVNLEQRPGWLLVDTRPRRLSSGIDLNVVEGVGDDDDSAPWNPYDLPAECFGDDDDSAEDPPER